VPISETSAEKRNYVIRAITSRDFNSCLKPHLAERNDSPQKDSRERERERLMISNKIYAHLAFVSMLHNVTNRSAPRSLETRDD